MTTEELVQRLIELHEEIEDRAEDAFISGETSVQTFCEKIAFSLENILDDII